MLNLNHLYYFYVCAQNRGVTNAARVLGISQPSLSQQLKIFEAEVGSPLFVRNGRTFELSSKGKAMYDESKNLFEIAEIISSHMNTPSPGRQLSFNIGVASEIERPFIAEIIGQILRTRRAQNVKFAVISKEHDEIAKAFRSGEVDLVISSHQINQRKASFEFGFPVHLITSKSQEAHRHSNQMNMKAVFSMLEESLVAPSCGLVLRNELDEYLQKCSWHPPIVFESNIQACAVRAIREGVGCGFVPKPYVLQDLKKGILKSIGPQKGYWQHKVYVYENKSADENIVKSFAQVIQEYCL